MAEIAGFPEAFAAALAEVAPVLDKWAPRLLLGAGARQLGRGGIKLIAAARGYGEHGREGCGEAGGGDRG